jgi:hypothetical protein
MDGIDPETGFGSWEIVEEAVEDVPSHQQKQEEELSVFEVMKLQATSREKRLSADDAQFFVREETSATSGGMKVDFRKPNTNKRIRRADSDN